MICGNRHAHIPAWRQTGKKTRPTFADSFHGADLLAGLERVQGEVNLGQRLLLPDGANGIVDLHIALLLLGARGRLALLRVHVGGRVRAMRLGWEGDG